MNILIGENIKRLRKMKNITQEELATVFNITPAAVCKWEAGDTYPDISFLFPLAYYFGVTIDELMGYDERRMEDEINNIITEYWQLYFQNYEMSKEFIHNAYQKYPNDCQIMHLYMWNKAGGNADNDMDVLLKNKEEFLNICEKILNNTNDSYLCLTCWNMKAKILHAEGKTNDALFIYDSKYPNFYHTSNQKKEQLFNKGSKEFQHFLSMNLYELTDFVINKKMKEIWFVLSGDLDFKIDKSYELLDIIKRISCINNYESLVLAEYSIISEIIAYMKRFNAEEIKIKKAQLEHEEIIKKCNEVARENSSMKEYIKKAYEVDKL